MTKVVTFYSYKGGVGRTMALVNTAHVLARDGWRVLMVDFDLEAPGMTHFFAHLIKERRRSVERDSLDLLLHARSTIAEPSRIPASLDEYVVRVDLLPDWLEDAPEGIPYKNGRLDLIPATLEPHSDSDARDYLHRMGELDLSTIFAPGGPGHRYGEHVRSYFTSARFEAPGDPVFTMRSPVAAAYDIVLLDSRTGLNEIAGLCIGPVCDAIIVCTGLNAQNVAGTRYFMSRAGLLSEKAKPYAVAAGPIPVWHTRQAEPQIARIKHDLAAKTIVEIPYHPSAAITETVFVKDEPKDPISKAYESLAPVIVEYVRNDPDERLNLSRLERMIRDGRAAQDIASSVAANLPLLRMQSQVKWTLPPGLATFPTALTMSALPPSRRSLPTFGPDEIQRLSIATAVAAYYKGTDASFGRARLLLQRVRDNDLRRAFAIRLLYFQFKILGSLPGDDVGTFALRLIRNVLGPEEVKGDVPQRDTRSVVFADALITALLLISSGREDAVRLNEAALSPHLSSLAAGPRSRLWYQAWAEFALPLPTWSPELLLSVSKADPDKKDRKILEEFVSAMRLRRDILEDESFVATDLFGRMSYDWGRRWSMPVGMWPESIVISAYAIARPKDVNSLLAWIKLARRSYGYAWRVIVDWRHLRAVASNPRFQEFVADEDERVAGIERGIDDGFYPL